MTLRDSHERSAASFTVPLDRLVDLRTELERRARAADIAGQSAINTAHHFAINELSKTISATRAAGKQDSNRNAVLDRAAARLLHRLADDLDENAAAIRHKLETDPLSAIYRQRNEHAAQTSEAEAARLWYALTVFMEHTGLGAEDLDTAPERRPRQATELPYEPG